MTDEELIAMARLAQRDERMSTGTLYGDLADRIDALGKACTEWAEVSQSNCQRAKASEAKLARAMKALESVMIGGNHLAVWLPDNHPPAEMEPLASLEKIGAGVAFDVWCCWRSIMLARATLAEIKGKRHE